MGKLCKNQKEGLVSELDTLFLRISVDKIDEVVDATKTCMTSEAKETKNRERLDAFDQQVKTLLDKGYPEAAGMEKDQFLGYVNPLRDKFEIGDIIVIPERIVSIPKQMSMVKINGKTGYTYLNLDALRQADGVKTSNVPYLIRDIENGAIIDKYTKQFKKYGGSGLVPEEGIAIVTHKPETLNDHYIDLAGSRYNSYIVPSLWLEDGRPKLDYYWADPADS